MTRVNRDKFAYRRSVFLKWELWSLRSRQRDREILQQEEEKTKENEPKQPCVLCLVFLPCLLLTYVPAAKATMLTFPPAVLTGLRTQGILFVLVLQWISFGYPSLQVARLPPQLFLGVMGGFWPFSMYFIPADVPESFQPNYTIKTKNKTKSPDDNRISIEIFPIQKH